MWVGRNRTFLVDTMHGTKKFRFLLTHIVFTNVQMVPLMNSQNLYILFSFSASRKGNVLLNPSPSQFGNPIVNRGQTKSQTNPAIPRSQEVKKYIEPSFSAVLKQNQAIYANYEFRSSDGSSQTEDEIGYTSPPSPVSSSYSELRVATRAPAPIGK